MHAGAATQRASTVKARLARPLVPRAILEFSEAYAEQNERDCHALVIHDIAVYSTVYVR